MTQASERIIQLARIFSDVHLGDSDELGDLARELKGLLDGRTERVEQDDSEQDGTDIRIER